MSLEIKPKQPSLGTNESSLTHKLTVHKMNNSNRNQMDSQEQSLSLAYSQLISNSSDQIGISLNKDQLYETFVLFQNFIKTNTNQLKPSNSNQCIFQQNISRMPFDNLKDENGRQFLFKTAIINDEYNNIKEEDYSRNNNMTLTSFDTNHVQYDSNNHNYMNSNYEDKLVKSSNSIFMDSQRRFLSKDQGDFSIKKNDFQKTALKDTKYLNKTLVKSNPAKKPKRLFESHESLNEECRNKGDRMFSNTFRPDDFKKLKFLNTTVQQTLTAEENCKDKVNNKDKQRPLSTNKHKGILQKKNSKSNSINQLIKPNKPKKDFADIKAKSSHFQSRQKIQDKEKNLTLGKEQHTPKNNIFNPKDIHNQTIDKPFPKKSFRNSNLRKEAKSSAGLARAPIEAIQRINEECLIINTDIEHKEPLKIVMNRDKAIKEKMEELNSELVHFKKEKEKVDKLKEEYEKLHGTLQVHIGQFNSNKLEFEEYKEEEIKKIEKEKSKMLQDIKQLNTMKEINQKNQSPLKKDKEEIDSLKHQIIKIKSDIKQKEDQNKAIVDTLKKQIEELKGDRCSILNTEHLPSDHNHWCSSSTTSLLKKEDDRLKVNRTRSNSNNKNKYPKTGINGNSVKSPTKTDNKNVNEQKFLQTQAKILKWDSQNPENRLNTYSHKTLDSCSPNKEDPIESYDLVLPDKYHGKDYSLLNQESSPDGKVVRLYSNNKREIIFQSGLKKEMFKDGYQIVYFPNGDIKQVFPDNKSVYFFKENQTVQTCLSDGLQIFKFSNGQIEKHFQDGNKRIIYPDGSFRTISKEGIEETFHADGTTKKVSSNDNNN